MDKQVITQEFWNKFFTDRDHTGRYLVCSHRTGVKYAVEPIGFFKTAWGDVNTTTKEVEGSYGKKYRGSIDKQDSLITEENGFTSIITLEVGSSPEGYIEWKDLQYPNRISSEETNIAQP